MTPDRFDYSPVGEEWAVLRLLTRIEAELAPLVRVVGPDSDAAELIVARPGETPVAFAARRCGLEHRFAGPTGRGHGRRSAGPELLWRAAFAVPLELVTDPAATFALTAGGLSQIDLPVPVQRAVACRALAIAPPRPVSPARPLASSRQRLAALATAVAITGTSTPAVALADGVSGSTGPSGSGGSTTTTAVATTTTTTSTTASTPTTPVTTSTDTTPAPAATTPAPAASPSAPSTTTVSRTTTAPAQPGPATQLGEVGARTQSGCQTSTAPGGTSLVPSPQPSGAPASVTPTKASCTTHTSKPGQTGTGTGTKTKTKTSTGAKHTGSGHSGSTQARHPSAPASTQQTGGTPLVAGTSTGGSKSGGSTTGTTGTTGAAPVGTLEPSAPGMLAPKAWTGTVTPDPALTGAVRNLAGLLSNGNRPPSFLIPIYMQAGRKYGVPWTVLAAINAIESDYGRDLSTSTAGALGWMQFEPSTWREWGVAVDGHSVPNPYDPRDAIFSAARYLKASGADHDLHGAIYSYNHAQWYVDEVMSRAHAIAIHAQYEKVARNKRGTFTVTFASGIKKHPIVRYSGGKLSHFDRLIAAANMVSAANFPYLYGGGHEQPARFGPFDCSGSVSYVMQQAGYKVPTTVSGDIPIWKFPAGPGKVTIFYNPVHTFMRIGNRFFGTSGFARPGGGAGWFDVNKLPADYLATFREVHVPHLGINSFSPTPRWSPVHPGKGRKAHKARKPLWRMLRAGTRNQLKTTWVSLSPSALSPTWSPRI